MESIKIYLLCLGIVILFWIPIDFIQRNSIENWCETQQYEVVDISHNYFRTGPFILSGKGYFIYEVKVKGNPTLWFRYSIFGKDIYQEIDGNYIEIKI
jgi:hypothetical protein